MPDPDTLARYGDVMSDLPERIVTMTEREVESRVHARKWAARSDALAALAVAVLVAAFPIVAIVAAAWMAIGDEVVAAVITVLGGLATEAYRWRAGRRDDDD